MEPATLSALREISNIAGVKEALGNVSQMMKIVSIFPILHCVVR